MLKNLFRIRLDKQNIYQFKKKKKKTILKSFLLSHDRKIIKDIKAE